MGILNDYIKKGLTAFDLEKKLLRLIKEYNEYRKTYLLVISSAIGKPIPDIAINQEDYFMIYDILSDVPNSSKKLDVYLETPGGSGEATEEIVKAMRSKTSCHYNSIAAKRT
jgi:ClpP class serine protease